MPTTNHGGVVTPTGGTVFNVPTSLLAMGQSIEPGLVGSYANNTLRDAGTLALRNAGVKGFKAFVLSPPTGDSLGPDWCGWNGTEWIWENPAPVTYNSTTIANTIINYTTLSGHAPSVFTFTPTRSGPAEVRVNVSAQSFTAGYGTAYLRPRFTSGTLFPGGYVFTVLGDGPAGTRFDFPHHYYVPVYLTKGVSTSFAFDLASAFTGGTWLLNSAQWLVTQT